MRSRQYHAVRLVLAVFRLDTKTIADTFDTRHRFALMSFNAEPVDLGTSDLQEVVTIDTHEAQVIEKVSAVNHVVSVSNSTGSSPFFP